MTESQNQKVNEESVDVSNSTTTMTHTEVVGVVEKEHSSEQNPLLKLNPGVTIWTWVVFIALLLILWKTAWRKILNILEERENHISSALGDAQNAKKEMEEIQAKQALLISQANDQARDIVAKGKETAEKIAKDIEDRSKEEAAKILTRAKTEIEHEKEKAIKALRNETATLAIEIASKLLTENLDNEKNRKLVESTINSLGK